MEALIPRVEKDSEKTDLPAGEVKELDIRALSPNRYQPRKNFDEGKLEELAASIREKGVLQPVVAMSVAGGYELIAGERRLQAAKMLGMTSIPAIVRSVTDKEMLELSLIENIQRDDLNPLEEAASYQQLMEEFGVTQEKLAEEVGKNRASVANTVRLLKLPEEVREELLHNRISRGHAIALLSLRDTDVQVNLCRRIIQQGLSVRETEVLVKRGLRTGLKKRFPGAKSPQLAAIEEKLQHFFGTRVNLRKYKTGGRMDVEYYSDEDLQRILDLLGIKSE